MSKNGKNSQAQIYYSGGLAELVSSPTVLTYSFLENWFTGKGSIGKAMKILGLPHNDTDLPVLELIDGDLVINLSNEEETLYSQTIFKYKKQSSIHETPQLVIDLVKIVNPICLLNTFSMLLVQSKWIANPKNSVEITKKLLEAVPAKAKNENINQIDILLRNEVWPTVIAIGLLCEFYNQLLTKEVKNNLFKINKYISNQAAKKDWFFRSIADQEEIRKNKLSFSDYIKEYGIRADKDYELTSPRWYEIPDVIKKRISKNSIKDNNQNVVLDVNKKLKIIIDASIKLQLLRSEAKRKALLYINQLRKKILQKTKSLSDISQLTRDEIINNQLPHKILQTTIAVKNKRVVRVIHSQTEGKGMGVSQGHVVGVVRNITSNITDIPKGTIGIFPNASPEFTMQYPKCIGMIFLKGGQTSHGAIVAREFGIPALIDHKAEGIKNGVTVELNGSTGEWRITV